MRNDLHKLAKGQEVGLCDFILSDADPYNYYLMGIHIMFEPENANLIFKGNYVWALYMEAALNELISVSSAPELIRVYLSDLWQVEPAQIVDRILESPDSNFIVRVFFDAEADADLVECLESSGLLLLENPESK